MEGQNNLHISSDGQHSTLFGQCEVSHQVNQQCSMIDCVDTISYLLSRGLQTAKHLYNDIFRLKISSTERILNFS